MHDVLVWEGWIAGIAIGLYALFQFWLSGNPLGVSTGFGNVCSLFSRASFFHTGEYEKFNNWRLWFLIGIPIGSLIAYWLSPRALSWRLHFDMGPMYEAALPDSTLFKALILFGGGILIGYGARLAGGCTSGHSIFGLALINPPSMIASIGFFIGGIVAVQLLFRVFTNAANASIVYLARIWLGA